jgi:hypothetical protein
MIKITKDTEMSLICCSNHPIPSWHITFYILIGEKLTLKLRIINAFLDKSKVK